MFFIWIFRCFCLCKLFEGGYGGSYEGCYAGGYSYERGYGDGYDNVGYGDGGWGYGHGCGDGYGRVCGDGHGYGDAAVENGGVGMILLCWTIMVWTFSYDFFIFLFWRRLWRWI